MRQGRGVTGAQNASTRRQAGEGHGWLFNRRTGGAPTRRQARWRMGREAQGAGGAGGMGPKESPERRPVWDRALNTMLAPLRSVPSHSPSPTPISPCPHPFSLPLPFYNFKTPNGQACLRPLFTVPAVPAGISRWAEHACAPLFTVPAVPAAKRRVPAPHYLQCLRCLRRRGGCLRPIIYSACGACSEE